MNNKDERKGRGNSIADIEDILKAANNLDGLVDVGLLNHIDCEYFIYQFDGEGA